MGWLKRTWAFVEVPGHSNALIAIFSVLLFFATILYTVFAALQWTASKQALHLDQRPWVVARTNEAQALEVGKTVSVQLAIANTGKTPAFAVEGRFRMEAVNSQEAPSFDYSAPGISLVRAYVLYPNEVQPIGGLALEEQISGTKAIEEVILGQQLFNRFNNREIAFVGYGEITYQDVFNVQHWATTCQSKFNWGPFAGMPVPAQAACAHYNNADENN